MRKAFALTVAFVLYVVFFSAAKAAPVKPNVTINVDKTTIAVGETVYVSWNVTGNYNLGPYGGIYGYWRVNNDDYAPDSEPASGSSSFTPEETGTLTYVILIDWDDEIYDSYVEYPSKVITVTKNPVITVSSPSGVKAASAGYDKIKLDWNPVSGASGYQIYRATSKAGTYSKVATIIGGTKKTYTNSGLTTGKTYYFKIRAYKKVGSSNKYGQFSSIVSTKPVLAKPSGVIAASAGFNKIKLKWNAVSGVSGYKLYKSTSQKGTYKFIKAVTTTSFIDTGLKEGKAYYYKILAYKKLKSGTYYSDYSQYKAAMPLSIPVITKVEAKSSTEISIIWKPISGVAGYTVYRSNSAKGTYAEIKKLSSTKYTDTGLKANTTYYYKICCYKTVSGVSFNSDYSSYKEGKTANNQVSSPFISLENVGLLTFDASAGTHRLRLQSNVNWYTSISEPWISVSYQNGGSGIYDMDISVQKNNDQSARTGQIQYIGGGGAKWTIEIKQSGAAP